MLRHTLAAVAATLALTLSATAGDKGPRYVLGPSKLPKSYPIFEHKFIKGIPGPTVSCNGGSCFGYHHTQWRSWAEACNEPQSVIVDAGSPATTMPPATPMPPAANGNGNGTPKAEPKKADPPKAEQPKKENTSIPLPAPQKLPAPAAKPVTNFEIVIPAPAVPANVVKPTGFAPTLIVPVPSK
jgi:hypothetical protein